MSELGPWRGDLLADQATGDPYLAALATWLEGQATHTRRAYRTALADFFRCAGGKHPRDVTPLDVAAWKEQLKRQGRAASTIAQRLSALSAYFTYLQRYYHEGRPLHPHNPVQAVARQDLAVSPYERARKITPADFRRLMAQIDPATVPGARDRALLLFYVLCARRRNEVLALHGRDLRAAGAPVTYRVRLKGGRVKWKELPPPVWSALQHYLRLAGRELTPDAPLFTATVTNGAYLRAYYGTADPTAETALTAQAVLNNLRRYARRAGLAPQALTLHSLRHLGAELFQAASRDVRQTQLFLDHAQLNTTQIYLEALTGEEHRYWQAMSNELGL